MIMCKYREHVSKLTSQNIADRRIKESLMAKVEQAARNNQCQGQTRGKTQGRPAFTTPTQYDNLLLQNKVIIM